MLLSLLVRDLDIITPNFFLVYVFSMNEWAACPSLKAKLFLGHVLSTVVVFGLVLALFPV
jgi:hypothetical protein